MKVLMSKFNNVLNGRPSAREDFLRIKQIVNGVGKTEIIELDFEGVEVLSPSYADELLTSLKNVYGSEKISIHNTSSGVSETFKALDIKL